jgi:hypothetical protein
MAGHGGEDLVVDTARRRGVFVDAGAGLGLFALSAAAHGLTVVRPTTPRSVRRRGHCFANTLRCQEEQQPVHKHAQLRGFSDPACGMDWQAYYIRSRCHLPSIWIAYGVERFGDMLSVQYGYPASSRARVQVASEGDPTAIDLLNASASVNKFFSMLIRCAPTSSSG